MFRLELLATETFSRTRTTGIPISLFSLMTWQRVASTHDCRVVGHRQSLQAAQLAQHRWVRYLDRMCGFCSPLGNCSRFGEYLSPSNRLSVDRAGPIPAQEFPPAGKRPTELRSTCWQRVTRSSTSTPTMSSGTGRYERGSDHPGSSDAFQECLARFIPPGQHLAGGPNRLLNIGYCVAPVGAPLEQLAFDAFQLRFRPLVKTTGVSQ